MQYRHVQVTVVEKSQLRIIHFQNFEHSYLTHTWSDKGYCCESDIAIFVWRRVSWNYADNFPLIPDDVKKWTNDVFNKIFVKECLRKEKNYTQICFKIYTEYSSF